MVVEGWGRRRRGLRALQVEGGEEMKIITVQGRMASNDDENSDDGDGGKGVGRGVGKSDGWPDGERGKERGRGTEGEKGRDVGVMQR